VKRRASALERWLSLRLRKHVVHPLCRRLYRDADRDLRRTIVVAGTGRSGTTWLANLVGSLQPCRLMFEPFHSRHVAAFAGFHYFQYLRPEDSNPELAAFCRAVLSGAIRHPWIDREVAHLRPRCRVVKEIRANLFLKWIHDRFPEVPVLFIVRHPCAVVLSRMQYRWATDGDIAPFLSQPPLVADFLADKLDLIHGAATDEEKHAVIWCISNLVPLEQFQPGELDVLFYEDLCTRPEREMRKVSEATRRAYDGAILDRVRRPSSTTLPTSAILTGEDRVTGWQRRLSAGQIRNVLSIVEAFGLGHLYGDSPTPLVRELRVG
jgi:hypothetical protein